MPFQRSTWLQVPSRFFFCNPVATKLYFANEALYSYPYEAARIKIMPHAKFQRSTWLKAQSWLFFAIRLLHKLSPLKADFKIGYIVPGDTPQDQFTKVSTPLNNFKGYFLPPN